MRNIVFLVPFYNEEKNLVNLAKQINLSSEQKEFHYKLLFLNDCSTDNSYQILKNYIISEYKENIFTFENSHNIGHGKSLIKLFELSNNYIQEASDIVTMDSDTKLTIEDLNELFDYETSIVCKRKRFEEGIFRAFITFCAELLVFLKTGKLWRDANCPLRLYKKKDFLIIKKLIPKNVLTPNIISTILIVKHKIKYERKNIKLISENKNSGVTWQGNKPLSKYLKILKFSFYSFFEIMKS